MQVVACHPQRHCPAAEIGLPTVREGPKLRKALPLEPVDRGTAKGAGRWTADGPQALGLHQLHLN